MTVAYLTICGAVGFLFGGFADAGWGVVIGAVAPYALCHGFSLIGALVGAEPAPSKDLAAPALRATRAGRAGLLSGRSRALAGRSRALARRCIPVGEHGHAHVARVFRGGFGGVEHHLATFQQCVAQREEGTH